MIDRKNAEHIHEVLIKQFGGSEGIRDRGGLEAALNRPYATFDGRELYPEPVEKAAAILESIVVNHPFIDGNKRTGYVLARLILLESNLDIIAPQDEKYKIVLAVSTGKANFEDIKSWLGAKITQAEL